MEHNNKLNYHVKNRKVLFVTTKNIDYIRNTQELRILKENAESVEVISSNRKNYVLRVFEVWKNITRKKINQNDVIFVGFAPQLVIPFVGWKFKNKLIVEDFFISVYDTLICDRKRFKVGGLAAKLCHWLDEYTLKRANHVITDTKAHAEYFVSEFGGDSRIFETIYLEADSAIYYPRIQNKPKELRDKFVVLYFGSILPLQGVDVVLGAVRKLKDRKDIYFDIIGPIPDKYDKPIQENVGYTAWLSQEELAEHIGNADLCLAGHFSGDIDKAWRTIPGKAYIYECMNKVMILGDGKANREYFDDDDKHLYVERGSEEKLMEKIVDSVAKFDKVKDNLTDRH